MVIYRVICAYLADEHGHVVGLKVRKWRNKKKSYGKRKDFSRDKVIEKIESGAVFRTKSRDRNSTVTITHGECGEGGCSEVVLRTISEHMVIDDLDYLRCPDRKSHQAIG